jgi:flagellar protein FlgJ
MARDLILGVLNAADPVRRKAAEARLQMLAADGFEETISTAKQGNVPRPEWLNASPAIRVEQSTSSKSIGMKFEAAVLSTLFQSMFPAKGETVFGGGVSGSSMKSLFAEQLANAVAARGGIGIAKIIDAAPNVAARSTRAAQQVS